MAKSNFFQSYYIDPTGARWEVPQISEENQRSFIRSVLELPDQRPRTTVHDTVEDDVDDEVLENDNVSASAQKLIAKLKEQVESLTKELKDAKSTPEKPATSQLTPSSTPTEPQTNQQIARVDTKIKKLLTTKTYDPPLKEDERFVKYFKMLAVGLPKGAVQNRMAKDGVDPSVLDMDPEKPLVSKKKVNAPKSPPPIMSLALVKNPLKGLKKKSKKGPKKPKDGLVRKKLHWKKLNKKRLASSPLWEKIRQEAEDKKPSPESVGNPLAAAILKNAANRKKRGKKKSKKGGIFELDSREIKEMKALFCISVDDTKKKSSKSSSKSAGSKKKKKKALVQLLDMTRANNISIVLARFGDFEFDFILKCMSTLDPKDIDAENFRSLLGLAPTKTELETLQKYDGPKDAKTLGKAERYCLAIGEIPRYSLRIRCFLHTLRFDEAIRDIEIDLDMLSETCSKVRGAKALHKALEVVLKLGNFLNEGGANGDADGVSIDVLNKLKTVKSYGTKTTLLHYFVVVVTSRAPDVLKMAEQCGDCRGAASVVLTQLVADLKQLQRGYDEMLAEKKRVEGDIAALQKEEDATKSDGSNQAEKEFVPNKDPAQKKGPEPDSKASAASDSSVTAEKKPPPLSVDFVKAVTRVASDQKERLERVTQLLEDTKTSFTETIAFYGEMESANSGDFFSKIADFIVEFEGARKDNEESRKRAKKRAAAKKRVEAMRKKTKEKARRRSRDFSAELKKRRDSRTPSPSASPIPKQIKKKIPMPKRAIEDSSTDDEVGAAADFSL